MEECDLKNKLALETGDLARCYHSQSGVGQQVPEPGCCSLFLKRGQEQALGLVPSDPLLDLPLLCSPSLCFTGSCVGWLLAEYGRGTLVPGPR